MLSPVSNDKHCSNMLLNSTPTLPLHLGSTTPNTTMNCSDSESPQNKSNPFSISAILSDEIGQKKSPTTSSANGSFSTPNGSFSIHDTSSGAKQRRMTVEGSDDAARLVNSQTPKRPKNFSRSNSIPGARSGTKMPHISLSTAGNVVVMPGNSATHVHSLHPMSLGGGSCSLIPPILTPHQHHPQQSTPSHFQYHHQRSLNNSLTISPFNANFLAALGQQVSPSQEEKEDLFGGNSPLGMLSTVAHFHSEMSGSGNSSLGIPVQERLANMKLASTISDSSDRSSDWSSCMDPATERGAASTEGGVATSSRSRHPKKITTPSILKKDKRRRRQSSIGDHSQSGAFTSSDESTVATSVANGHAHLNIGFLSPLATENSLNKEQFSFSPSIFLSRPDHTHSMMTSSTPTRHAHNSPHTPTTDQPLQPALHKNTTNQPINSLSSPTTSQQLHLASNLRDGDYRIGSSSSPGSDSETACMSQSDRASSCSEGGGDFVTSTPIKSNQENVVGRTRDSGREESSGGWSPTILLNGGGARRHLRELNEPSSGSDSELPVKKQRRSLPPQQRRKKSKARTKLSPLLENACSPIRKEDIRYQPSPLTTALSTTPTRGVQLASAVNTQPESFPPTQNSTSANPNPCSSSSLIAVASQSPVSDCTLTQSAAARSSASLNATNTNLTSTGSFISRGIHPQLQACSNTSGTVPSVFKSTGNFIASTGNFVTYPPHPLQPNLLPQSVFAHPTASALHPPPTCTSYGFNPLTSTQIPQAFVPNQLQTCFSPVATASPCFPTGYTMPLLNLLPGPQLSLQQTANPSTHAYLSQFTGTMPPVQPQSQLPVTVGIPHTTYNHVHHHHNLQQGSSVSSLHGMNSSIGAANLSGNSSMRSGGRGMSSSHQMQSVPPWFIFSNNRTEGKRSRLTEAINRSLSETPSQSTKLPAEWTKLACGQTDDQKALTEKARTFMQCRPRQLTFNHKQDDIEDEDNMRVSESLNDQI